MDFAEYSVSTGTLGHSYIGWGKDREVRFHDGVVYDNGGYDLKGRLLDASGVEWSVMGTSELSGMYLYPHNELYPVIIVRNRLDLLRVVNYLEASWFDEETEDEQW
jgi:hypothetical protein